MSTRTEHSLRTLLRNHDVPDHSWCHYPNAKTVADLLGEIQRGESRLVVEMGRLVRSLYGIGPNIFYHHPDGRTVRLIEARRVYEDGHIETRNLKTSLGEKIPLGELPQNALLRALREELGMDIPLAELTYTEKPTVSAEGPSASYPGLITRHHIVRVDVTFTDSQYRPNGYTEVKDGRTTYFEWVDFRL